MRTWQLNEAQSRFSEVVDLSLKEGPQLVTRRGEESVVIVSAQDFRCLSNQTVNLIDCLLNAPRGEPSELDRPSEIVRPLAL